MKKSKILSVALAAALISSFGAIAANAEGGVTSSEDLKSHSVGVTGSFNNWGDDGNADTKLTDDDGDGIYEGDIVIAEVTDAMLSDWVVETVSQGVNKIQFKVRLDESWDNSWGQYEDSYERTFNSQTNCAVDGVVGQPLTIHVVFDTTKADPAAGDREEDLWNFWGVSYSVVDSADKTPATSTEESSEASVEESSEASVEESSEASVEESSEPASAPAVESSTDDTTPETGDATSAAALVAVVLASLGTAVIMTKKASAKD